MKYAVWFLRLLFASWMIPAGVNHFVRLFPQPMGSRPLSHELIVALIDSHLFDVVKLVELIAGLGLLAGFYAPLVLLICMPVSFCVFYWDAPLEGWGSRAAKFGYSVLLGNVLLCLAWIRSYRPMFAVGAGTRLLLAGRLILGTWMLANGINHFLFPLWGEPLGHAPLAMQLMTAFVDSGLFDVAMAIQLAAGALLLAGVVVPVALCVLMPVSTCALYWSLVLDHRPLGAALALAVFALNGLLMLGNLDYYRGVLQRRASTFGEHGQGTVGFEAVFVQGGGRAARSDFIPALLTLLAVVAFYVYLVKGRTSIWCLLVLLFPAGVLLMRRLRDMGQSPWLLLVPAVPLIGAFALWLGILVPAAELAVVLPSAALAICAAFGLWGCLGRSR